MKKTVIILTFLTSIGLASAQNVDQITLDRCYEMAVEYSTIGRQRVIQEQVMKSNIKGANSGYLPKAEINAQVSYQSQVVELPFSFPGLQFDGLAKDQYKATFDLQQVIYDGGYIARQKRLLTSNLNIENNKLDVSTLQLKSQVASIYLGILLLEENMKIVEVAKNDLKNNIDQLNNMVANGVAMKSNVDLLEAEQLKADQQLIELKANRKSMIDMLTILVGQTIDQKQTFVMPQVEAVNTDMESQRPEFRVFEAQNESLELQKRLVSSKNIPRAFLFGTVGNGRPGLNLLSNNFDWFYMVGAKLTVPLTNWTATKHEKQVIVLQKSLVDQQKEDFTRQNRIEITNQLGQIDKYKQLIATDSTIIAKRADIRAAEQQRLLNGIATSIDYVTQLNAESQAMLNQKLHNVQLVEAIINYKTLLGIN